MNALTTQTKNTAIANADFANPFATAGAGAGSTIYVKFKGASGDYLAGSDEEEIPHGTQLAADIMNSKWSWQFWWDNELLETVETDIIEDPKGWEDKNMPNWLPAEYDDDMSLEEIIEKQKDRTNNFQDGWGVQAVVNMRQIGGEELEYTFRFNNGVSLNAYRALLASFGRLFQSKPGLVPIVELDANQYKSKQKGVGTRYAPKLKIVDWKSEAELLDSVGDNPEDYDDGQDNDDAREEAPRNKKEEAAPAETQTLRGRRGGARPNYG